MRLYGERQVIAWQLPEWWRAGATVERAGTTIEGVVDGSPGRVVQNAFAARPDAHSLSELVGAPGEFLLAQQRGGRGALRPTRLNGVGALHGRAHVAANDCAGLRAGTIEVWLDRRTLLPLRVLQRRGRRLTTTFRFRSVGRALPSATFAAPRVKPRHERLNDGFHRTAPAHAAGPLPYVPRLPTELPARYRLAVSGWARRGNRTGPEASIPRHRWLFAAVYRRGLERIDVTQRLSGGRGWPGDPFGTECGFEYESRTQVNGHPARYALGPEIPPHLYWHEGRFLFTVSGPYPKQTLVRIAESRKLLGS